MGPKNSRSRLKTDINTYFHKKEREQMKKFSKIEGYMENSGEWISYVRECLEKHSDIKWVKKLLKFVLKWDARSDRGTKAGLVWLRYIDNSSLKLLKTSTRTRISGLEDQYILFESTIFENMYKSLLYAQLTKDEQHILFKINFVFAQSLEKQYSPVISDLLSLKSTSSENLISNITKDINTYIKLLKEIVPKFYPHITSNIDKKLLGSIIRYSMITGELFNFLIKAFRAAFKNEDERFYEGIVRNQGLSFTQVGFSEQLSLSNGEGYLNVIKELKKIENTKRLVDIADTFGMLPNNITCGIDAFYPQHSFYVTTDDLIPILSLVLVKSEIKTLPSYIKLIQHMIPEKKNNKSFIFLVQCLSISIYSIMQ
jgi:hypothetical protein